MSPIHLNPPGNDDHSETIPGTGPDAHEDLTIGDLIHWLRMRDEHRPAELCFRTEDGTRHWLPARDVASFVRRHGAEHPANYMLGHGHEWEQDFFR